MSALLQLAGISKRFGAVQALHDAAFVLRPGEVHALLGENGAGKSTLMKIVNGMTRADRGTITLDGAEIDPASPREAQRLGIGMVHQHFSAVPAFSVGQNIALAAGWRPSPRELRTKLDALMSRVGLTLAHDQLAEALTVAQKQALEILMALAGDAKILLLDEPTAVLAGADAAMVLTVVRRFAERGGAVVLITHKLEEALRYADRITVLRRGSVMLSGEAGALTAEQLVQAMLGDALPVRRGGTRGQPGAVIAQCQAMVRAADIGGSGLRGTSVELRGGEVVGVAAVEGNGERELLRVLGGILGLEQGECGVNGQRAFIPEDRTTEALIPAFSLIENRLLAQPNGAQWLDWSAERSATGQLISSSGTKASGPDSAANGLSGGNQQRFVIARQLEAKPDLIVAENPGRGLDIKAADDVFQRLRNAAAQGAAVIFHSADLDEVMTRADRVVVMQAGRLIEPPRGADRETIGRLMLTGQAATE